LRDRLNTSNNALSAREGELELTRMELARLNTVIANSARYRIPADLAAKIYDVALAEGIDPKLAYSLVRVESDFTHGAISSKGALGLTQLMPATARFFEPRLQRADLFDPETNLHIGFRFLKELIAKYHGDVDLALHAYNRGPSVVDKVVRKGGDPANGYADAVMKGAQ
jgi:soluble lytic murein transglycosylase-like protein